MTSVNTAHEARQAARNAAFERVYAAVQLPEEERQLPQTLHELLEVALTDVDAALAAGATVRMTEWIYVGGAGPEPRCAVCLAGAVLLRRLTDATKPIVQRHLGDIGTGPLLDLRIADPRLADIMCAIDRARSGDVSRALAKFYGTPDEHFDDVYDSRPEVAECARALRTSYSYDRHDWAVVRPRMVALIQELRAASL